MGLWGDLHVCIHALIYYIVACSFTYMIHMYYTIIHIHKSLMFENVASIYEQ